MSRIFPISSFAIVVTAAFAAVSVSIAADSADPGPKKTTKVEVDGQPFRVTHAHGEIVVASKSFMTRKSPGLSARMHRAVQQVTGCGLKDEVWTGNTLRGNLDCPK